MKVSLVIMAAGLGSRYGGSKQVDGVGPHGEILMEYSIHDALRAGFNKVVFIIKPDMREMVEDLCGRYVATLTTPAGEAVEVAYAYQDYSSLPDWYEVPEGRTKPYGTVHALLCAADVVKEPFCVINADDYYGIDAYRWDPKIFVFIAYSINISAFLSETIRASILAVPVGQLEAGYAVGMTTFQTLRDIIAPQAFKISLPMLGSMFVGLFQATALAYLVNVFDMMGKAVNLGQVRGHVLEGYLCCAFVFALISLALELVFRLIQKKLEFGQRPDGYRAGAM